jgi:hypothetical protein
MNIHIHALYATTWNIVGILILTENKGQENQIAKSG